MTADNLQVILVNGASQVSWQPDEALWRQSFCVLGDSGPCRANRTSKVKYTCTRNILWLKTFLYTSLVTSLYDFL